MTMKNLPLLFASTTHNNLDPNQSSIFLHAGYIAPKTWTVLHWSIWLSKGPIKSLYSKPHDDHHFRQTASMDDWQLAFFSLFCLLALLLSLFALLAYSGLFSSVDPKTTNKPPIGSVVFAYKDGTGPYQNCGSYFSDSCSIAPTKKQMGIYYDDPEKVITFIHTCDQLFR